MLQHVGFCAAAGAPDSRTFHLVYCAKTAEEFVFREELEGLVAAHANITVE